jgi:hypothetical protein
MADPNLGLRGFSIEIVAIRCLLRQSALVICLTAKAQTEYCQAYAAKSDCKMEPPADCELTVRKVIPALLAPGLSRPIQQLPLILVLLRKAIFSITASAPSGEVDQLPTTATRGFAIFDDKDWFRSLPVILAFAVVLHHSFPLRPGAWAVDVFFILSGATGLVGSGANGTCRHINRSC